MSLSQIATLQRHLDKLEAKIATSKVEIPPLPPTMLEFAKQFRLVNKRPFTFDYVDDKAGVVIPEARKYLYEPYTTIPNRLMFVKGRQMEVTEYAVNYTLWHALKYQGCTVIYTSPRRDQVSRFSKQRLRKWGIKDSPKLRALLVEEPSVQELNIGESIVYLYSAWGDADALRNISADVAILDEVQDIPNLDDTLPVIEENLAHGTISPPLDRILLIGTPKNAGEPFEKLWRFSSQKEWDKDKQAWIPKQAADPWEGYHISQTLAPWIPASKIDHKRRFYVTQKFENEVLGLFFKGAGRPLTVDDMDAITDKALGFEGIDSNGILTGVDLSRPRNIYTGNDWGTGQNANTAFIAIEAFEKQGEPPTFKVLYYENVSLISNDPLGEIQRITALIDKFGSKRHVADIGYGYLQLSELRKTYGDRVIACKYLGNVKEPLQYKSSAEGPILEADRSIFIDKAIDIIKRKRITLPGKDYDLREWAWKQFVCLYLEAEESGQGRRYKRWQHDEGANDDLFQSLVYALLAYEMDAPARVSVAGGIVGYGESVVGFGDE